MKQKSTIPAGLTSRQRQQYKLLHFVDHYAAPQKAK